YFFGPRTSVLLTGQSWHTNEPVYDLNTNGGRVSVERVLARPSPFSQRTAPNTSVSLTYIGEFQSYQVTEEALRDPSILKTLLQLGLDPLNGRARGLLSSVGFEIHHSTADSTINARQGY